MRSSPLILTIVSVLAAGDAATVRARQPPIPSGSTSATASPTADSSTSRAPPTQRFEPSPIAPRPFQVEWLIDPRFRSANDNAGFPTAIDLPVGGDTDLSHVGMALCRSRLRTDGTLYCRLALEADVVDIRESLAYATLDRWHANVANTTIVRTRWRDAPCPGTNRVSPLKKGPIGLVAPIWRHVESGPLHDAFDNPFEYPPGIMAFRKVFDERTASAVSLARSGCDTINPFDFDAWRRGVPDDRTSEVGAYLVVCGGAFNQNSSWIDIGQFSSTRDAMSFDAEHSAIRGAFAAAPEFAVANTANAYTPNGSPQFPCGDIWFQSGYVETGYFVAQGESRSYNTHAGILDRTVPNANLIDQKIGFGAMELVLRYSYLNLISGQPTLTQIVGARAGDEHDVTLGLNWYLSPQTVIKVNYVRTRINSVYPYASGDIQGLGVRLHLDF